MRVIAGTARGRRILAPPGNRVRPTPARVREALFAILGERVEGRRVLDLYCGSGALGIEALSRGALWVTFVDSSRISLRVVAENLRSLGWMGQARLVCRRCPDGIDRSLVGPYDLVLSDPPYGEQPVAELAWRLCASGILGGQPIWVHEGAVKGERALRLIEAPGWRLSDERRYGDTGLWFFELEGGH